MFNALHVLVCAQVLQFSFWCPRVSSMRLHICFYFSVFTFTYFLRTLVTPVSKLVLTCYVYFAMHASAVKINKIIIIFNLNLFFFSFFSCYIRYANIRSYTCHSPGPSSLLLLVVSSVKLSPARWSDQECAWCHLSLWPFRGNHAYPAGLFSPASSSPTWKRPNFVWQGSCSS